MTATASLNQTQLRCISRREQFTLCLMYELNMILILLLATLLKGKKTKTYTAIFQFFVRDKRKLNFALKL